MKRLVLLLLACAACMSPAWADDLAALDDLAITSKDDFYHFLGRPVTFRVGGSVNTYTFTPIGHVSRESGPNRAQGRFGMNTDAPLMCMEFPGEKPSCWYYTRYDDVLVLRDENQKFRMESDPVLGAGVPPWPKPVPERCRTLRAIHKAALSGSFDLLIDLEREAGMTSVLAPPFLWSTVKLGDDVCRIQPTDNGPELQCQEYVRRGSPAADMAYEEHVGQFMACFGKDVTVSGLDLQVEAHGMDWGDNPAEGRISVFKLPGRDRILMNLETRPFCDPHTHVCEEQHAVWITWETP